MAFLLGWIVQPGQPGTGCNLETRPPLISEVHEIRCKVIHHFIGNGLGI